MKFTEGAWIIAVSARSCTRAHPPNRQYVREERSLRGRGAAAHATMNIRMNRVVVFGRHLRPRHRALVALLPHAERSIPIRAVHFDIDPVVDGAPRGGVGGAPGTASAGITLEIVEC